MMTRCGWRRLSVLLSLSLITSPPVVAAQAAPAKARGFQLFTGAIKFEVNRVSCGISTLSELCSNVYLYGSSTIGANWPKGTANNYMFNSGPQVAGIIGSDGGPWANDTSGAYFFDAKGTTQHASAVQGVFFSGDSAAAWPEAGRVVGSLYHPALQGRIAASEGDAWWLTWEGDPGLLAGRQHPLGLVLEGRALGWSYPSGNQDIVYYILTYHNITSLAPAAYAHNPPALRAELLKQAQLFHNLNNAKFGVTLPPQGYTIHDAYLGMAADVDVGNAGANFASVNMPFSLAYAWDWEFTNDSYYSFPPEIHSPPFFVGFGLGGVKFLGGTAGAEEFAIYSNTTNGGPDIEPRDVLSLYRLLSNSLNPALGDGTCFADVAVTRICFIRTNGPTDVRQHQSTGPFALAPGGSVTLAVAYVFAAPVRTGATSSCPSCNVYPGNLSIVGGLADPAIIAGGVNPIDSVAGFLSASDLSGDGVLQDDEFLSVPRSLYGKAQLAQAIFDAQFLLPSAPATPDFFLIPGDGKVTVMWRPSATEQIGDPFFSLAKDAQVLNEQGVLVPHPLYDPNYRQFDVEGYRIYRGRSNDPDALQLIGQFDYTGTVLHDFAGQVNPTRLCAPELGVIGQCPVAFDPVAPGLTRVVHVDVPLVGPIEQVRLGDRIPLTDGSSLTLRSDTMPSSSLGYPYTLIDNGVPFAYEDNTVRNNFRYFYAVTAFDINSYQSGPSSFESPRILKAVTPARPASNHQNTAGTPRLEMFGRGIRLDSAASLPTIDPVSGRFSGPFPPAPPGEYRAWWLGVSTFLENVFSGPGSLSVVLDSITLGSPYDLVAHLYWWTASSTTSSARTTFSVPILQAQEVGVRVGLETFSALEVDPGIASRFGGGQGYTLQGQLRSELPGADYAGIYGRGCVNRRPGFADGSFLECAYNGSRWFDGPSPVTNETKAHPIAGNTANFSNIPMTSYNNAGELTGVVTIFQAQSYQSAQNFYRQMEGSLAGARRAADFNVHWGTGGRIDSVIDVTYNVEVPFHPTVAGGTWGILNQGAAQPSGVGLSYDQRVELTVTDMSCVEPFRSLAGAGSPQSVLPCGTMLGGDGPQYVLSQTAIPGRIAFFSPSTINARTQPAQPNDGFVLYLAGSLFTFELAGGQVPAAGRAWALRTYVGAISGGSGDAGNHGPYLFSHPEQVLPLTAVGVELRLSFDVINQVNAPTTRDLSAVHTVPDPYYLSNAFESDVGGQTIKFVNLPQDAVIRIYSASGVLVTLLEHHSTTFDGAVDWDVRNRTGRRVSSGVYFYHLEAGNARRVGRFTIVNDRPGF